MRNSKLIFAEGLPGTGKSTTASAIASKLKSEHLQVNLWLETDMDHPLNVGGDLHPAGFTTGEALFQRYKPDNFVEESLNRWQAFVHKARQVEAINVLDSFPYQNSVRILLQMDASFDFIAEYAASVESVIMPLQPVLIYFNQPNVDHYFKHMDEVRTQRGKQWTDYVIDLITNCPYAQARNLQGYEGVLTFIRAYKQLLDALLQRCGIERLILEDCAGNWDDCYRKMSAFLKIP